LLNQRRVQATKALTDNCIKYKCVAAYEYNKWNDKPREITEIVKKKRYCTYRNVFENCLTLSEG